MDQNFNKPFHGVPCPGCVGSVGAVDEDDEAAGAPLLLKHGRRCHSHPVII
jgi:hypothetical protein